MENKPKVAQSGQLLLVYIFPMPKGNDIYHKFMVENIVDYSIIAYPDSVTVPALMFFATLWCGSTVRAVIAYLMLE